jgi:hypothetical protein
MNRVPIPIALPAFMRQQRQFDFNAATRSKPGTCREIIAQTQPGRPVGACRKFPKPTAIIKKQ